MKNSELSSKTYVSPEVIVHEIAISSIICLSDGYYEDADVEGDNNLGSI